jgi:hypothetical protein
MVLQLQEIGNEQLRAAENRFEISKKLLYGDGIRNSMQPPPKMQDQPETQGELEQKRADFVRMMEEITPRAVLDAIEHVKAISPPEASEWPEFITQTYGACYASQE